MTFREWLKDQEERDDEIGWFARKADELRRHVPRGDAGLEAWHRHLHRHRCTPDAVDVLHDAWREYQYGYDPRYDRLRTVERNGFD